jgi:PEGA domain
MTRRHTAVALALSLAAPVVWADQATRRGGGSSGGSSSVGARHSGSSGPHASSSGGSHSSSRGGGDSSVAQRRHPRAGTGTGYYYGGGRYYGRYPYYPYSYWYPSFYFGYAPYWSPYYYGGFGYGYGPYYGGGYYGGYGYEGSGSVRVLVDQENARVYVDGYYAGVVDDFDGLFQRLHVSPGRHEITIKLDGYQTYRAKVYVPAGSTLKLHYDMVKGQGEVVQDLAGDAGQYARRDDRDRDENYRYRHDRDLNRDRDDRYGQRDDDRDTDRVDVPPDEGESGTLRLDVRPEDASVYVDGRFRGTARQNDGLELPAGRHHVEVVRPGFKTLERDVEIEAGRTAKLSLELERP